MRIRPDREAQFKKSELMTMAAHDFSELAIWYTRDMRRIANGEIHPDDVREFARDSVRGAQAFICVKLGV